MRFDLCYLEQRLIVEYDGRRHADSPEQWNVISTGART
jgi:very-short-patch-repair endonuclease